MPKRSSRPKEEGLDENQVAWRIVQEVTREPNPIIDEDCYTSSEDQSKKQEPEPPENPAAVTLGRLGGLKGGKARAAALTPEKRAEIAKKVAEKRWKSTEQ